MLLMESDSSKKSICSTQKTEKEVLVSLKGASCCHAGRSLVLSRGVDVQLTLQDVVDDGLSQVVHNMAVTVLQGQSDGGGANMDSLCTFYTETLVSVSHDSILVSGRKNRRAVI